MQAIVVFLTLLSSVSFTSTWAAPTASANQWQVLNTVSYKGKQDDIYFVDRLTGWYVNGAGYIYHTADGGATWTPQLHQAGTYFRSVNFTDALNGYAGNIGTDYFPGVTDPQPLYQTHDGGNTWTVVTAVTPTDMKGICSIDSMTTNFIDAGHLESRTSIYAAGRVGGPAKLAISRDAGQTWKKYDLTQVTAMIQDVKFLNESTGFVCAGSDPDVDNGHAQILKTVDGGDTWKSVYLSRRPLEVVWKCFFPSEKVGYGTVLNFDDKEAQKYVAKTIDGGETWQELPLVNDASVQEFGVAFLNEQEGWIGTADGLWHTADGGNTWDHQSVGHWINKIRIIKDSFGVTLYAIGQEVLKLELPLR